MGLVGFDRYDIETIQIYYRSQKDMVIIGSFNDPHGPRKECGKPFVINGLLSPVEVGTALCEIYNSCLNFSQADLMKGEPPYVQATGITSWSKFAKGRKVIHIEWAKNGIILLERWEWLPNRGFGPSVNHPQKRTILSNENLAIDLGTAVLGLINEV